MIGLFPHFKLKEVGKIDFQSFSQYVGCADSCIDFPAFNTSYLTWHNFSRICQVFLRYTFAQADSAKIFPEGFDYFGVLAVIHVPKIDADEVF